jgi:uncharacterized protein (DUF697 family)
MDGTKSTHSGSDDPGERARIEATATAPVIWLLGKAQAGKTSIAACLTGTGEEGVGLGFQRTTREPGLHAWPPPPAPPVLLFLDTPGIGADDGNAEAEARRAMAQAEDQAHVILVVARAEDLAVGVLVQALTEIRQRHRDWPVIVAQTRLHDLYPTGMPHLLPYPFDGTTADFGLPGLPQDLMRALATQRRIFASIPGEPPTFVPVDLTRAVQGFEPRDYGAEALLNALGQMQPETADTLREMRDPLKGARLRVILPWALMAAATEAPPLPFLGLAGATTGQGLMLRAIAARCGVPWTFSLVWRFLAVLGPGILTSAGASAVIRQVLKLGIGPGTAAAAAAAFTVTWAAGEAGMVWFGALGRGEQPDKEAVRSAWRRGFEEAVAWWKRNRSG